MRLLVTNFIFEYKFFLDTDKVFRINIEFLNAIGVSRCFDYT
jgi:hypothetical protein